MTYEEAVEELRLAVEECSSASQEFLALYPYSGMSSAQYRQLASGIEYGKAKIRYARAWRNLKIVVQRVRPYIEGRTQDN